jgi:hypothetical protein
MRSIKILRRAIGALVDIVNDTISSVVPGGTASATYALNANGTRTNGTWLRSGVSSNYECRATLTAGTFSPGSSGSGTWLSLSGGQSWTVTATNADKTATFTLEIRIAGGGATLDTATITIDADGTP